MPEHDTFDLDMAFRDFERDVSGLSHARGAGAAICTARRRRRTAIGGVVAGLALAVGAAVIVGTMARPDAVAPVDRLPAPAPFDATHLTSATRGWTPAWGVESEAARNRLAQTFGGPCVASTRGGDRNALQVLANGHGDVALATMNDYGEQATEASTGWRQLERQLERCETATLVSSFRIPSGGAGQTYRIAPTDSDTAPEYAWIVTTGHQVGELKIFGQSRTLPAATDPRVARAFLAALQDPASYTQRRRASDRTSSRVEESDFAHALGGWVSGWRASGRGDPVDRACTAARWWRDSTASMHGRLGGNGREDIAHFASSSEARAAAESLLHALDRCSTAQFTLRQSSDEPGSLLVVASGPATVWVAQHGLDVAVVRVPSAGTPPPSRVTADVGALMLAVAATYDGSGS